MATDKRPKLFELDEWRKKILPNLVKACRIELLRARELGKKGGRVNRQKLLDCVRKKAEEVKKKKIEDVIRQAEAEKPTIPYIT
jgi:hypothetical protein